MTAASGAWPAAHRAEHELLLAVARAGPRARDADRVRSLLTPALDWAYLRETALVHGLLPFLLRQLAAARAGAVPAAELDHLRRACLAIAASNTAKAAELVRLLRRFEGAAIPTLPFKGPVLAAGVYGDLALRAFNDLDVAVPERCVPAALAQLHADGYRLAHDVDAAQSRRALAAQNQIALIRERDGSFVELHWRFGPEQYPLALDVEEAFGRARPVTLAGRPVPSLGREDLVIVLCAHGARHTWEFLEWICGVAEVVRGGDVDWAVVRARAARAGAERLVRLGAALAHDLLGAPLPAEVLAWVRADPRVRLLAEWVVARLFRDLGAPATPGVKAQEWRFHVRARERVREKVRAALYEATMPPLHDWARRGLPDRLFPLYRVAYPVLRAGRMAGRLAGLTRGR